MASDVETGLSGGSVHSNGVNSSGDNVDIGMTHQSTPQDALVNNNNQTAGEATNESEHTDSLTHNRRCHSGNCCVHFRHCLESSSFSFSLGSLLFAGGCILIGVSSNLPQGDFFLIGPFCVAAGVILLIRGCINKLAKRQAVLEAAEQAEAEERRAAREARRHLTREERSQRNEEQALSQDNLQVPPPYEEVVVPKPQMVNAESQAEMPRRVIMVSAESQVNFGDLRMERTVGSFSTQTQSFYDRLASVQSQTTLPSMHSVALSTSDLPAFIDPDTISTCPPSYDQAISPHSSSINIYLPEDDV